jgi:hypothetical protein
MVNGTPYTDEELEVVWRFGMEHQGRKTPWATLVPVVAALGTERSKDALTQCFKKMLAKAGMTDTYRNTKATMVKERRYSEGLVRAAEWQRQNPGRSREKAKRHRDKHSDSHAYKTKRAVRDKRRLPASNRRQRERRKTDGAFRAIKNARCRLWWHYHRSGNKKCTKTYEAIGCTRKQLADHLVEQLREGETMMGMDMDHIFPLARYKFGGDRDQLVRAANYRNTQPLTTKENNSKSDKLPTKAMAAKVPRELWPDGITEDMLPDIYPGWSTPLRM